MARCRKRYSNRNSLFDIRIETAISNSNLLISLLSSSWSLRPEGFCRNELLYAQATKIPIIPVRLADVIPPDSDHFLNYVDACDAPELIFSKLPKLIRICCAEWQNAPLKNLAYLWKVRNHGGHLSAKSFPLRRKWQDMVVPL